MSKKGQGVIEYVVLLAIVITISSLTAIVAGLFGASTDSSISQSDIYWDGVSRPFAVPEHAISANDGQFYMLIKNTEPNGLQISKISFASSQFSFDFSPANGFLYSGEDHLYNISLPAGICASSGIYNLNVNITYSTQSIANKIQFGQVPLAGSCSAYDPSQNQDVGATGSSCANPNDCDSHFCHDGVCVECIGNGHCPLGQQCSSGICVECSDEHCGPQ